jgi:PKD repeat protein/LmbE family N-acetylglucosaminyl deacetylase
LRQRLGIVGGSVSAFLAIAVVVLVAPGAISLTAAAADCSGTSVYTDAHADDSFIFQSPDLQRDINNGRCVRTIFITASDAGGASNTWLARENGAKTAYAQMAATTNAWTQSDVGVAGHPMPLFTLDGNPKISLVFMRLPDGNLDGSGFATYGNESLQKLWTGAIADMHAVDGTSSYTKTGLISALAQLLTAYQPDLIATQDYVGRFGDGDHPDHHAVGYFTQSAAQQYSTPHTLTGYRGYPISALPANLTAADTLAKQNTYFAYVPYDPTMCQTLLLCQGTSFASWWQRQYGVEQKISTFNPSSGTVGTTVTIAGAGFTGTSSVKFNGAVAAFNVDSDVQITARVPDAATTGPISVDTPLAAITSATTFVVTPQATISGFEPTSGPVGTTVTITGAGFTGTNSVKFNGVEAAFNVDSAAQITATVPDGATTGTITATTPAGTVTSATSFVVTAPVPENHAPTAAMTADVISGPAPLTVTFDGSASSDPDSGDTLTYVWNFGDGTVPTESTSAVIQHVYSTPGAFTATLNVRDNHGATSTPATVQIEVVAPLTPPENVTAPEVLGYPRVGQTLTATTGTWTSSEPLEFTYEWVRCAVNGSLCTPIPGTADAAYVLVIDDWGSTIRVLVTATNAVGSAYATSDRTARVKRR